MFLITAKRFEFCKKKKKDKTNERKKLLTRSLRFLRSASEKLTLIIDAMGDASFKAQGLAGPVTTARKFRQADHRLYIIKKSQSHK